MSFIHQLISDLEREPPPLAPRDDTPSEVLRFAPKKVRGPRPIGEDSVAHLKSEVEQWQNRAKQAEARLHSLEERIQRIADDYVYSRDNPRRHG
jgi:hypothetical protein